MIPGVDPKEFSAAERELAGQMKERGRIIAEVDRRVERAELEHQDRAAELLGDLQRWLKGERR